MTDEERKIMQMALDALSPDPYRSEWLVAIDMDKAIVAIQKCLANDALEKKAENARELGLNYEPEPVAWMVWGENNVPSLTFTKPSDKYVFDSLYMTAPQRTWVGLTDEAIWLEYQTLWPFHPAEEPRLAKDIAKFARAIEAKLRSKNHG